MKALNLFLMFSTSSIIGLYFGHMMQERKIMIAELNNFFKYLVIKISSKSGTLQSCVNSYNTSGSIKPFLKVLIQKLECGCACPFESASKELYALKKEDIVYIESITIGTLDYNGQIKALENAICYFDSVLKDLSLLDKKRQIASYSGVLTGAALIIIFI